MTDEEAVEAYQRTSEEMQERDAIIEECARAVEADPSGLAERVEMAAERVRALKSPTPVIERWRLGPDGDVDYHDVVPATLTGSKADG
jgi:hypothetical protein